MCPAVANAGVRRVWVVNDGEKVERDALSHPAAARNSAWDGRRVYIFGARNEIVAFQVVVEADARGIKALSVRLPELDRSATDPLSRSRCRSDRYVDRPIAIFTEHYMDVTTPSHASWVYDRDSPAAPPDPTGWKPVQLVPENARAGRGGMPIAVQAVAKPGDLDRDLHRSRASTGSLSRQHRDPCGRARKVVPIELEVFNFTIPTRTACTRCCSIQAISRSSITDAISTRLPPAGPSESRRVRAGVRRADAAACDRSLYRDGFHSPARLCRPGEQRQRHRTANVLWSGSRFQRARVSVGAQRRVDDISPRTPAARTHVPVYAGRAALLRCTRRS